MKSVPREITVLVADDDCASRIWLRQYFATQPDYRIVGEAADGIDAVERCRVEQPDLALLDIEMPLLDGISAADLIRREHLAHCVIMLTSFDDGHYVDAAIDAGAVGYLLKPFAGDKVLPTIELCLHHSKETHLLRKNIARMDRRLGQRELTDRVKLLLMENRNLSEQEAYDYIRELSRRKGLSMEQVAAYLLAQAEKQHG